MYIFLHGECTASHWLITGHLLTIQSCNGPYDLNSVSIAALWSRDRILDAWQPARIYVRLQYLWSHDCNFIHLFSYLQHSLVETGIYLLFLAIKNPTMDNGSFNTYDIHLMTAEAAKM